MIDVAIRVAKIRPIAFKTWYEQKKGECLKVHMLPLAP